MNMDTSGIQVKLERRARADIRRAGSLLGRPEMHNGYRPFATGSARFPFVVDILVGNPTDWRPLSKRLIALEDLARSKGGVLIVYTTVELEQRLNDLACIVWPRGHVATFYGAV